MHAEKDKTAMPVRELPAKARALLAQLRIGNNVADAPTNIGEFAYSTLAKAFLSNAKCLCRDDGMSDYRVYGTLYCLRHGLELMLKYLVRNDMIDTTLRVLMAAGCSFDDVCVKLDLARKKEKAVLQQSLCTLRNALEDRLSFPDCKTKNVDRASAERALAFLRQNPTLPRNRFAVVWSSTVLGHNLSDLWTKAAPTVAMMAFDAKAHAHEIGFDAPLTQLELEGIVELLATLDDGGDSFRYPSSLDGEWYVGLPSLSLDAVGRLASKLESTCAVFESVQQTSYDMATVAQPTPQYCA